MSVKYVAMKLISFVDKGSYSNIVLNDAFKEFYLTAKEKAFITEIFYGVLRNKNFLDLSVLISDIFRENGLYPCYFH